MKKRRVVRHYVQSMWILGAAFGFFLSAVNSSQIHSAVIGAILFLAFIALYLVDGKKGRKIINNFKG